MTKKYVAVSRILIVATLCTHFTSAHGAFGLGSAKSWLRGAAVPTQANLRCEDVLTENEEQIPQANSGFFGSLRNQAGRIVDQTGSALSSASTAAWSAGAATLERVRSYNELQAKLTNGMTSFSGVIAQVREFSSQTAEATTTYTVTVGFQIPIAIWRIIKFDGSVDSIKNEIIIPFAGLLAEIRQSGNDPIAKSKALAKLSVFTLQVPLMLQRGLPNALLDADGGGALLMGLAMGVPEGTSSGNLARDIGGDIRRAILDNTWAALTAQGLSFRQRLDMMANIEEAMVVNVLPRLAEAFGWNDLQTEVAQWSQTTELRDQQDSVQAAEVVNAEN